MEGAPPHERDIRRQHSIGAAADAEAGFGTTNHAKPMCPDVHCQGSGNVYDDCAMLESRRRHLTQLPSHELISEAVVRHPEQLVGRHLAVRKTRGHYRLDPSTSLANKTL
jgi:hypothetical protein